MNHKPDSVTAKTAIAACCLSNHLSGKAVTGHLHAVYPRCNRRTTGVNGKTVHPTLLDFAPDEVCLSGSVTAAEVGSYPALSPFPCYIQGGLLSVALSVPGA